jgi:3-oxoadipate enol-lactonase
MNLAQTTTDDGCKITYRLWGASNPKARIALVHSLAMDGAFWTETVTALGPDIEVLAIDCRGHGQSDKPAGPYDIDTFADDLSAAMDDAGWDTATVAGASMGGCVALAFAARHPDRCSALGLIDTTATYGPGAEKPWEGRAQKALTEGMGVLADFQRDRWFSEPFRTAHPDRVDAAIAVFMANDTAAFAETCRMLGRVDLSGALPAFTMPTEIIVGEHDYATPPDMARAMQQAIPDAKMQILPDMRHLTPLEVPDVVAAMLRRLTLPDSATGHAG